MEQQPPPQQPTDAQRLWNLYRQAAHTLRATLAPPVADTQEEFERRDYVALDLVGSLSPANADEVALATQYVAAYAYAMDCLRLMRECPGTPDAKKLGAGARSTMREARGARSLLLRVQKERHQPEKDNAACKQDGWSQHIALELMSEALGYARAAPVAAPPPEAEVAPEPGAELLPPMPAPAVAPPAPEAAPIAEQMAPRPEVAQPTVPAVAHRSTPAAAPPPEPAPVAAPLPPMTAPVAAPLPAEPSLPPAPVEDGKPLFDPAAEAERYAIVNPRRAALIRQRGGVPDDCDFGPPEPELVPFIVSGTSPALRALDGPAAAMT